MGMTNEQLLQSITTVIVDRFDMLDGRIERLEQRVDKMDTEFRQKFEQIDQKFEQIGQKFEQIDRKFEQIDRKFEQIDRKFELLWSSIFVTLMANKIGGLQFGIYRNCQISSRVFHTAVAALPLTKANRSDFE